MTTPLIRALRLCYPKATIDYLVGTWSAPILRNNPHLHSIHTFDDKIFFDIKAPALLSLIRKIRKQNYDAVIVLDKSYTFGCYARLFGTPTAGFNRSGEGFMHTLFVDYDDEKHDIEYNLDLAKKLGCTKEITNTKMEFFPETQEKNTAKKLWKTLHLEGKKVVGLTPGGGMNPGQNVLLKRWPKYQELAQRLLEQEYEVLLFGGKGDAHLLSQFPKQIKSVIGKTTVGETAVLMSMCDVVVTNDSGPMHIASAMAKRVIAIFGPTNPQKLGPLGKQHIILWNKKTICPPCNTHGTPACYHNGVFPNCPTHACMENITVDQVLSAVKRK